MRSYNSFKNLFSHNRKILYIVLSVVMLSVLTLTIVYAALSTTLNINGTAEVTSASWDIHFANIKINQGSVEATTSPTIINSRTINFVVGLKEPGDYYKFTVDIVNNGTIDAMIDSVVKTPTLTETQAKYLKYEIEYTDGNSILDKQPLPKETTKTMSILVAYRSDVASSDIPTEGESLNLSFTMNYVQANETSTIIPDREPTVRVVNGDINTVGSEICIGEECFYLMKNDGKSITMFAKYNLYVGSYCTSSSSCMAYGDEATGIQDSTMLGRPDTGSYPRNGITPFSLTAYWGSINSGDYVYSSNSLLYNYVENYKIYLKEKNVSIEEARLIKFEELETLGCNRTNLNCNDAPEWVYKTSYWTGAAHGSTTLWRVYSDGAFGSLIYSSDIYFGVRPVIKISLSNF